MTDNWHDCSIADIASPVRNALVGGPFGSNLVSKDYVATGIPVIRGLNMGERWISGEFVFVSNEKAKQLSPNTARPGDLIFTQRGTLGQVAIAPEKLYNAFIISQSQMKLTVDKEKADTLFIYYVFKSPEQQDYILRNTIQTGVPHTNLEHLRTTPLFLPPLPEQRAIAGILGTLDDKIELNRRMNRTLESMARAMFRQWFVVNEDVDDWEVGKLGDVAENIRRSTNADEIDPETHYIGLEHMPRGSIALSDWGNASELASNKFIFKEGEFLFGKLRPYFHKVGIAPIDGVCSTDILVVAPKSPEWNGFVLGHISSVELINYTNAASTGTKMPRTNWSDLANYEVAIPPVKMAKEFSEIFLPMAQRLRANIMESRTLASLRDTLLPKLMRGEVRVKVSAL